MVGYKLFCYSLALTPLKYGILCGLVEAGSLVCYQLISKLRAMVV